MLLPKKAASLKEDDGNDIADGLSFKKICSEYAQVSKISLFKRDPSSTYKKFKSILEKYAPPIKLAGEGSSRAVFACIGGRCLKVAMNEAGIA